VRWAIGSAIGFQTSQELAKLASDHSNRKKAVRKPARFTPDDYKVGFVERKLFRFRGFFKKNGMNLVLLRPAPSRLRSSAGVAGVRRPGIAYDLSFARDGLTRTA
jgi:hypothetical protein